jgi:glycosyltransferase involved in cell wall biosynthesis
MIKLSILICTLEERKQFLQRLLNILKPQKTDNVEILVNCDNGKKTIGQKRNELLNEATGEYIAFCDDDDRVSNRYVELILKALESNPDTVGIHLLMTTDKVITEKTYHSIKYRSWYDEPDPDKLWLKRYFRNPNHLNPVKREHALKVMFPEINMGEDKVYSTNLLQYLKTEEYIPEPIYFYEFRSRK